MNIIEFLFVMSALIDAQDALDEAADALDAAADEIDAAYEEGRAEGYDAGREDLFAEEGEVYENGFQDGYNAGFEEGVAAAYKNLDAEIEVEEEDLREPRVNAYPEGFHYDAVPGWK
jgi:flagellar biosynthesis/type III secretory pathway protein FliH